MRLIFSNTYLFFCLNTPIYIIEAIRTPFGKLQGSLAPFRADDMAAALVHYILQYTPQLQHIENTHFYAGASNQAAEDSRNIAKQIALLAHLPLSTQGITINALCNAGIEACIGAIRAILCEDTDIAWVCATENMSRSPFIEHRYTGEKADSLIGWRYENPNLNAKYRLDMASIAELQAQHANINRNLQDEYAFESRLKYNLAQENAYFNQQFIFFEKGLWHLNKDEQHRTFSLEALNRLPPLVKNGKYITLGNSARAGDGAVLLLLASEKALSKYNLTPKACIKNYSTITQSPLVMNTSAIAATYALLHKNPKALSADIFEISESFALQTLLYVNAFPNVKDKCNIFGGAISVGNPTASGNLRLFCNILAHFKNNSSYKKGIIATCAGLGLGAAFELENV